MGNRGIIHDPDTQTLHPTRRWSHKAWIICLCAFKGRRRALMSAGTYTELFFLDEATALAAGHRPCFECRRTDAARFQAAWAMHRSDPPPRAAKMDMILHAERLDGRTKRLHALPDAPHAMPDGTILTDGQRAFVAKDGQPWLWSVQGYRPIDSWPAALSMLTPPSTLGALQQGYVPHIADTGVSGGLV